MPGFVEQTIDFEREQEHDAKAMKSNRPTAERFSIMSMSREQHVEM